MLTLKPQGWNLDVGIKASTRGSRLEFEWGGKEEAGDDGEGEGGKGGKIGRKEGRKGEMARRN